MPPIEIDCRTVKQRLDAGDPLVLVDCRERDEHAIAQIPGARLIPMSEFVDRAGELAEEKDRELVVFCHHGVRSLRVAGWLRQNGCPNATSLRGGIDTWAVEIDPSVPRY